MRILIATDSYPPKVDGVADTAIRMVRELRARGHQLQVIAPRPAGHGEATDAAVGHRPSIGLPHYPEVRVGLPVLRPRWSGAGPDAAIILTPGPIGLSVLATLPRRCLRVVVHTTDIGAYLAAYRAGLLRAPMRLVLRWMGREADWTLAPTAHVARGLRRDGLRRVVVWGRGVDHDLFRPGRRSASVRAMLSGGSPDAHVVLYVGRLAREKRLHDLEHAIRSLPEVRFAFVGDGPLRTSLERRLDGSGTTFTGYLRGEQLAAAYASADCFAFPSDSDTFGQVVLQALASGVPPVVVAGTGTAELVRHGIDGLHVPARDPVALRAAIERILADGAVRRAMSIAAMEAGARRSWPPLIDELEAMLAGRYPRAARQTVASAGAP